MELTINIQDVSKLQSLFALLNTYTLNQDVTMTVKYAQNGVLSFPVSDEQRSAAWLDIQQLVNRTKLRPGEAEMAPEDEEAFIFQEIKAAREEERAHK
ncbi:MAG: hypothetical protein JST85_05650 [Acidobacteria bacterium]|nr:hypothetical protein [Acidobacteriota bacterium]